MATQKLFSVTVMFEEEDFPFENKKKEMFSVETHILHSILAQVCLKLFCWFLFFFFFFFQEIM